MKRVIITAVALLLAWGGTISAQETEKKEYLPKAGEWAIGFDAAPVLKFAGNFFNGNTDNDLDYIGGAPSVKTDIRPDISIMGKYMLTDQWALRANVGLLLSTRTNSFYADDDAAQLNDPLSEAKVVDRIKSARHGGSILLGAEYRKGKRRVQGVFGAGLLLAFQNSNTRYTYGNAVTDINQNPSTGIGTYNPNIPAGYRPTKMYGNNMDFYLGVTGSAGFEWFVAPKISLGMEVNLSLYYRFGSQTYVQSEGYNTAMQAVEKRTDLISPANGEFYFGTQSLGGALAMNFYF